MVLLPWSTRPPNVREGSGLEGGMQARAPLGVSSASGDASCSACHCLSAGQQPHESSECTAVPRLPLAVILKTGHQRQGSSTELRRLSGAQPGNHTVVVDYDRLGWLVSGTNRTGSGGTGRRVQGHSLSRPAMAKCLMHLINSHSPSSTR